MRSFFLAHILNTLQQSDAFPVYGTPQSSLFFALIFTAAILGLYLLVDRLPKPKKNLITSKVEPVYIKTMIGLVLLSIISAAWDFWWHRAIGRESFFIPPHISLYTFATAATLVGFYVWRHSRDAIWKHITFLLLMLPVIAVFDNYFHTIWGFEDLSRPLFLVWSPSHVALIVAVLLAVGMLLKLLLRYRKTSDFHFFGDLCFAALFGLLMFLILPFYPTGPWGQLLGFAGAGLVAFLYVGSVLAAERVLEGRIDGTMTSIFILVMFVVFYGKETAPNIILMPHDKPPMWLFAFSVIVTGILLDLTKNRFPIWVRGFFGGLVWSMIIIGFSPAFFAPQFQYGIAEISTAVTFSAIGGLVIGSIFGLFHLDDEKHIEKLLKKW